MKDKPATLLSAEVYFEVAEGDVPAVAPLCAQERRGIRLRQLH